MMAKLRYVAATKICRLPPPRPNDEANHRLRSPLYISPLSTRAFENSLEQMRLYTCASIKETPS